MNPTSFLNGIDWGAVMGVIAGVGLAAAAGFRVFIPLLVLAIANRAGVMGLSNGFEWLASTPALVALSCAAVVEITAYYVPWVDHALDTLAVPAAVTAGTLMVASQVGGADPWAQWILGIVAGGGAAGIVQGATMLTRGLSLVTTAGVGNPIVATAENGLALLTAVLAVLVPMLAVVVVLALVTFLVVRWATRPTPAGVTTRR